MGTSFINRADKKAYTEGSLGGMISLDLRLLGNFGNETLSGVMTVMSVPVVEAFRAHELAEVASVSGQTSDGNTHVIINVEDLLLMAGEVMRALLKGNENL